MAPRPDVTAFFDEATNTVSYVVADPATRAPPWSIRCSTMTQRHGADRPDSADQIIAYLRAHGLDLPMAARDPCPRRSSIGGALYPGEGRRQARHRGEHHRRPGDLRQGVQCRHGVPRDGSQFDSCSGTASNHARRHRRYAMHTPGHTPACMTYVIGDAAFVGDTLFMPDYGTARSDFPGGDAAELYRSIQELRAAGRDPAVHVPRLQGARARHIRLGNHRRRGAAKQYPRSTRRERGRVRRHAQARDKTLGMPKLIIPSIQVNMRAGQMPQAEDNGKVYLKVPLDLLESPISLLPVLTGRRRPESGA